MENFNLQGDNSWKNMSDEEKNVTIAAVLPPYLERIGPSTH